MYLSICIYLLINTCIYIWYMKKLGNSHWIHELQYVTVQWPTNLGGSKDRIRYGDSFFWKAGESSHQTKLKAMIWCENRESQWGYQWTINLFPDLLDIKWNPTAQFFWGLQNRGINMDKQIVGLSWSIGPLVHGYFDVATTGWQVRQSREAPNRSTIYKFHQFHPIFWVYCCLHFSLAELRCKFHGELSSSSSSDPGAEKSWHW